MNLSRFLEHWSVVENPFRAQEARHDRIFARLEIAAHSHPDFEKILGDLHSPSTSIVFGEKGSGKTAIRLQLAQRIDAHNERHATEKVWLIAYDDLNPLLDWFASRQGVGADASPDDVGKALEAITLVDHMDGILHVAVRELVDVLLGHATEGPALGEHPERVLRHAEPRVRRDLLLLQALYDGDGDGAERARALRRLVHAPRDRGALRRQIITTIGWILPAGVLAYALWKGEQLTRDNPWTWALLALTAVWVFVALRHLLFGRWQIGRTANKVWRDVRMAPRTRISLKNCLEPLPAGDREPAVLPIERREDTRYQMFNRLRGVLKTFGFRGIIVVMDRVDEPTLVNGDIARMRSIVWPMLRNKFLQQDAIGIKLLLPLELHREVFRESSTFFQEVRLDKQSLVERLTWTGAMLYDLCNARLKACRPDDAAPLTLADMFAEDVSRQDVVDALDQMHRPRDAFKLLYDCMLAHCSNFSEEQAQWQIPRLVLDTVKAQQAERVQMFHRGFRPA